MYPLLAAIDADAAGPASLLGALVIAVSALASVAVYLFLRYDKRNDQIAVERKAMDDERKGWQIERTALRSEYDGKHRELAVGYARELTEQIKIAREESATARREFADTLDGMVEQQQRSSDVQVGVIEKLTDRIVIQGKRGGGY